MDAIEAVLKGKTLVDAEAALSVSTSLPHGHVALVHAAATRLGLPGLLGPACRKRDLAYALICSRVLRPQSKLSTLTWWKDTTLAGRHLSEGGRAMVDLSSSWVQGRCCELAARGYSRDGRKGTL